MASSDLTGAHGRLTQGTSKAMTQSFASSWWIGPVFTTSVFICGSFVLIARGQAAHPFLQLLHVLGYSPGPREQDADQHNPQPGYHVHGLMQTGGAELFRN